MPSQRLLAEPVSDADIQLVTEFMNLERIDEPRQDFLRTLDTVDVSACPGSGKTTLVVAKLAILAHTWPSSTQGICVLSHTNVAREEIQRRLSDTAVGHRLLSYPHYIDTIHGFINRYLAVPWLLSQEKAITAVDNDVTAAVRAKLLGANQYGVNSYLGRRGRSIADVRLSSANLDTPLAGTSLNLGATTPTYRTLAKALKDSAEQGYFCHDEMLLFAEALIESRLEVVEVLARRFPFVLIDEMQDTSTQQSRILNRLFDATAGGVRIQRVGDANQSIYDYSDEVSAGEVFPDLARGNITLPNSFRFDNSIATLASNLAVRPVEPDGLVGVSPPIPRRSTPRHTVFVFPKDDTSGVLPAYGAHILRSFEDNELATGAVTAVGQVHMAKDDVGPGHKQYPGTVSHYWKEYRAAAARLASTPPTLIECLYKARSMVVGGLPVSEAVDTAATGFIYYLNYSGSPVVRVGSRPHRSLERLLGTQARARAVYREALTRFVVGDEAISKASWNAFRLRIDEFGAALTGQSSVSEMQVFAEWRKPFVGESDSPLSGMPLNAYRYRTKDRSVDIYMSSIHAVKGQTHLATLVLETFHYDHVLAALMPWLVGDQAGANEATGVRNRRRLLLTYVAMTRPSQLVCLAIPDSSLGKASERDVSRAKLASRGWSVVDVG